MAENNGLAAFKNVLLAPLAKVASQGLSSRAPEALSTGHAISNVSRHDHHNIELKTVSELTSAPSLVETDIYLFVPKSFEITSHGKPEMIKDFRSRIRLALPVHGEQGAAALESALKHLCTCVSQLEAAETAGEEVSDLSHTLCEETLEATKDLCSIIAESLKHGATEHSRQFFLSHTLMTTSNACVQGLSTLATQVASIHAVIERVRVTLSPQKPTSQTILAFFDEYVSHLYVQYLGTIRTELSRLSIPKEGIDAEAYQDARSQVEKLLDLFQSEEATYRVRFGAKSADRETELEREHRILRLSHLKKFFQSKSFVDVTRQQSAKKIGESTATLGTAVAGITAAMLERFSRPEVRDVAFHGFFVLCFGVIIYVLRDRMKDWVRNQFQERALQFLPDFEQTLMAKEKRLGTVKEWFRYVRQKETPADILKVRQSAATIELERRLPEDIFHCRKIQEVAGTSGNGNTRALHENTRLNFERYLKHMDDPFKEFTDLDPNGRFLHSRSHRVYHFYLCVKTVSRPIDRRWTSRFLKAAESLDWAKKQTREQRLLYRVVLDKTGVIRIEDLHASR